MEDAPSSGSDPESWVATHGDALFAYCLPRVRDREAAEDLVQETFLAALQGAAGFRGDAQERTWLIGILRNKVADHHRRRCRERTVGSDHDDSDPVVDGFFDATDHFQRPPGDWGIDPARAADDHEFWDIVRGCLGTMPTRLAGVFTLRVIEEVDPEQVCKDLAVTPTNLWVMLHRARARLRECLEQRWFNGGAS